LLSLSSQDFVEAHKDPALNARIDVLVTILMINLFIFTIPYYDIKNKTS